MALNRNQALVLARALRDLRETTWPDRVLTQGQLAKALSSDGHIAPATLSSWESTTNPKTPSAARLTAYARFLLHATDQLRSEPHLIPEDRLTPTERERVPGARIPTTWSCTVPKSAGSHGAFEFDAGPVIVICPEAPPEVQGSFADQAGPELHKAAESTATSTH